MMVNFEVHKFPLTFPTSLSDLFQNGIKQRDDRALITMVS